MQVVEIIVRPPYEKAQLPQRSKPFLMSAVGSHYMKCVYVYIYIYICVCVYIYIYYVYIYIYLSIYL